MQSVGCDLLRKLYLCTAKVQGCVFLTIYIQSIRYTASRGLVKAETRKSLYEQPQLCSKHGLEYVDTSAPSDTPSCLLQCHKLRTYNFPE